MREPDRHELFSVALNVAKRSPGSGNPQPAHPFSYSAAASAASALVLGHFRPLSAPRPKSNVFAIHCSLQSLSHISERGMGLTVPEVCARVWHKEVTLPWQDTLGPLGRVIGVCSRDPQKHRGRT